MIRRTVEVYRKDSCPESRELSCEIKELGITEGYRVSFSRLYIIEFDENTLPVPAEKRLRQISREILADPVVEEYSLELRNIRGLSVEVYFKKGVLDITGRRAVEASAYAGLDEGLENVSSGSRYIINAPGGVDDKRCRYIAQKLLFNKVIQEAVYTSCGI